MALLIDHRGKRVPCTRGDEPAAYTDRSTIAADVFPAHAGMNRWRGIPGIFHGGVPCTRGDEPSTHDPYFAPVTSLSVPCTRGDEPEEPWKPVLDGPCSLHTRG